jgi:hypothetical protein
LLLLPHSLFGQGFAMPFLPTLKGEVNSSPFF